MKIINFFETIYESFFKFIEKYYYVFFTILCLVLIFLSFYNLGNFAVMDWDEARHGISAYEMIQNNNYIVNTYNYSNDYWNLKPPLSFWSIALSFKLFGFSIFSFRFFSAFSLLATAIVISIFILKRYGKLESLISLASFSIIGSFYFAHLGRHGDADSLFMLLFTLAMLSMLIVDKHKIALYFCGFFFALAFLTKSWHAFSIVAIGGLFLLFTGEITKFTIKQWIIFILSFTVPIGSWIVARVIADGPKFLVDMIEYDLLKRSSEAIEGHGGSAWYYYDYLFSNNRLFTIFMIFIILFGIGFYFNSYKNRKNDVIGFALWLILPFALFTKAQTKLFWYIIPMFVPLIIISSIFLGRIIKEKSIHLILRSTIILLFAFCIAYYGVYMIRFVRSPQTDITQSFMIENISNNEDLQNKDAYIEVGDPNWSQSKLLIAEISGNLKCNNGGVEAFLNSEKPSILIVSKDKFDELSSDLSQYEIISSDDSHYIISN